MKEHTCVWYKEHMLTKDMRTGDLVSSVCVTPTKSDLGIILSHENDKQFIHFRIFWIYRGVLMITLHRNQQFIWRLEARA